jgi:hypothetical protein
MIRRAVKNGLFKTDILYALEGEVDMRFLEYSRMNLNSTVAQPVLIEIKLEQSRDGNKD